jgi:hypothetical protein
MMRFKFMKWDMLLGSHNMGASNAYDVESYRNGAFTQK